MNLRGRLGRDRIEPSAGAPLLAVRPAAAEPDRYRTIKQQLHRDLIGKLDLALMENMEEAERPRAMDRLKTIGIDLPHRLFERGRRFTHEVKR